MIVGKRELLKGVKVVELSTYAAAPGCGRILADMGADVIKVEPPAGDPFRKFGLSVSAPVGDEEDPCFQLENAGKRSIAINLKTAEGKEVFFRLLADANIFFTNTRIQSLKKMGIDYDSLKEKFPHLVYGHISGYGLKGKDASMPGYDITGFWARGGSLADLAFEGNGPLAPPTGVGDHTTSIALAAGLLAGLYKQKMTGEGEYVLTSLFGSAVYLNGLMNLPAQYDDAWPKNRFQPLTPISNTYSCADGEMITLTILDYTRDWGKFCKMIGREDLIEEERFNNQVSAKEYENSKELITLLTGIFKEHDRDYWVAKLKEYDLPFSKTQHMREIAEDPQAWANGYLVEYTFPNGHAAAIPSTPIQFGENAAPPCEPFPKNGEHTVEILKEYGYGERDIVSFIEKGAVVSV